MQQSLSIRHLNVWYGEQQALKDISIDLPINQITAIIGPSGCGKSTFLKSLNRLLELNEAVRVEGRVLVDGENIYEPGVDVTDVRTRIGLLAQKPFPLPMSIYDNVAYGMRIHGIKNGSVTQGVTDCVRGSQYLNGYESAYGYREFFVLTPERGARYDCDPADSLSAHAERRGVSPVEAYVDLCVETDGAVILNWPVLNQDFGVIAEMLQHPLMLLGLADAGAHVGQILDASQPTFFLSYWVLERGLLPIEEGVRRLTSDTAAFAGFSDRGRLAPGFAADVNVIDLDRLGLPLPTYVHDFPGGAGRFVQRAEGYRTTLVNGEPFMVDGEHTGTLAGAVLRPGS